jgi:hypothetical protein
MNQPVVSVVMAVCNADRFLTEAIQSILNQSLADFELIIVDYGSTDNSKSIVLSYVNRDERVKLHEIAPCLLPEARNAGSFRAQGRYIAVMDADDVSLPDRLRSEVDYMESHPHVALLGGAVEWMDSSGKSLRIHRHPTSDREIKSELLTHSVFWHPTMIMRKEAFDVTGGYRRAFVCAHDYDLVVRIAEKHECANLEEIVLKYRVHPQQISSGKQTLQSLCILAVHASATARRTGELDPLDTAQEITPSALVAWGIGEHAQRNCVVTDGHVWIRNLMTAGEFAAALSAARRIFESDLDQVDRGRVAELYLTVAAIHWKEKRLWKCMMAIGHAFLTRPVLIGRPLKPVLRRLRLK